MPQATQLSAELTRSLLQLARALLAATRNWMLYPPEHPAIHSSVERLAAAIRQSSSGTLFSIGITPDTLLIEGTAAEASQCDCGGGGPSARSRSPRAHLRRRGARRRHPRPAARPGARAGRAPAARRPRARLADRR